MNVARELRRPVCPFQFQEPIWWKAGAQIFSSDGELPAMISPVPFPVTFFSSYSCLLLPAAHSCADGTSFLIVQD